MGQDKTLNSPIEDHTETSERDTDNPNLLFNTYIRELLDEKSKLIKKNTVTYTNCEEYKLLGNVLLLQMNLRRVTSDCQYVKT